MHRAAIVTTLALLGNACSFDASPPSPCPADATAAPGQALACYRDHLEQHPPEYAMTATTEVAGVTQRIYRLKSQRWSPDGLITPADWLHDVAMYIPANARRGRAVLVVNNGVRNDTNGSGALPPSDFTVDTLAELARRTRTVVVSVSDIPNQPLSYADDGQPRSEDGSVAHGWRLYLQSPHGRSTLPLQIPMAGAVTRAMSLAERELASLGVDRFVVSGISKRGWASWLAAIADSRVEAIVPFGADVLDMQALLAHLHHSYGGNWPIAMQPYVAEGIDRLIDTPRFADLMRIIDPLRYLDSASAARLAIPKYIVNASGDDFFVPDAAARYIDRLPDPASLRMVPNAGHYDLSAVTLEALSPFVNRLHESRPLAQVTTRLTGEGPDAAIAVTLSEPAQELTLWRADNAEARDFRVSCGIRYAATPLRADAGPSLRVAAPWPTTGWSAYFVEARFADGFVATSPAYIVGKMAYPRSAPPADRKACRTVPDSPTRQPPF